MRLAKKTACLLALVMLLATSILAGRPLQAQCSLCRTAASAQSEQAAKALNRAIIVLLVPPVSIMCLIFGLAVRGSKQDEDDGVEDPSVLPPGKRGANETKKPSK